MLMRWMAALTAGLALFAFAPRVAAQTSGNVIEGIAHYRNGDPQGAVERFLKAVQQGGMNGALCYNLGNAYLKSDDPGRAILWYERALRYSPTDPDLRFNLNYARSKVRDMSGEHGASPADVLYFWRNGVSDFTMRRAAILASGLFWLVLLARTFISRPWLGILAAGLAVVAVLSGAMGCVSYLHIGGEKGIVLPSEAAVRSGYAPDAAELFTLHAGTRVRIDREEKGHYRIFYEKGKIGWMPKDAVGKVAVPHSGIAKESAGSS